MSLPPLKPKYLPPISHPPGSIPETQPTSIPEQQPGPMHLQQAPPQQMTYLPSPAPIGEAPPAPQPIYNQQPIMQYSYAPRPAGPQVFYPNGPQAPPMPGEKPIPPGYGPPTYIQNEPYANSPEKPRNPYGQSPTQDYSNMPVGVPLQQPIMRPQPAIMHSSEIVVHTVSAHEPTLINCPVCGYQGISIVKYAPGSTTYMVMLLLCVFAFPCVCVPLCVPGCQDALHRCPSCLSILGVSPACSS